MGKSTQLSADPNNKAWKDDKSSFGHKMMAKMGWTEGKGLGKKNTGVVENVKVSKKIDNSGLGNRGNASDVCTKMAVFENILSKLQPIGCDEADDDKIPSEKKKRKHSKRVHMKVSKKSQKDLDEIFAK